MKITLAFIAIMSLFLLYSCSSDSEAPQTIFSLDPTSPREGYEGQEIELRILKESGAWPSLENIGIFIGGQEAMTGIMVYSANKTFLLVKVIVPGGHTDETVDFKVINKANSETLADIENGFTYVVPEIGELPTEVMFDSLIKFKAINFVPPTQSSAYSLKNATGTVPLKFEKVEGEYVYLSQEWAHWYDDYRLNITLNSLYTVKSEGTISLLPSYEIDHRLYGSGENTLEVLVIITHNGPGPGLPPIITLDDITLEHHLSWENEDNSVEHNYIIPESLEEGKTYKVTVTAYQDTPVLPITTDDFTYHEL